MGSYPIYRTAVSIFYSLCQQDGYYPVNSIKAAFYIFLDIYIPCFSFNTLLNKPSMNHTVCNFVKESLTFKWVLLLFSQYFNRYIQWPSLSELIVALAAQQTRNLRWSSVLNNERTEQFCVFLVGEGFLGGWGVSETGLTVHIAKNNFI